MGMHANQYYYAGGLDEWFFETDSNLAIDDLIHYFRQAMLANGGDTSGDVDALTEPGVVTLRNTRLFQPTTQNCEESVTTTEWQVILTT
ncbi:MAG: hypothetical protein GX800_01570 [Clostridiaceae bacterium]|jgi:hypothetical protein|nr:hypothetical protein [Clostridiaceae bacterium]